MDILQQRRKQSPNGQHTFLTSSLGTRLCADPKKSTRLRRKNIFSAARNLRRNCKTGILVRRVIFLDSCLLVCFSASALLLGCRGFSMLFWLLWLSSFLALGAFVSLTFHFYGLYGSCSFLKPFVASCGFWLRHPLQSCVCRLKNCSTVAGSVSNRAYIGTEIDERSYDIAYSCLLAPLGEV